MDLGDIKLQFLRFEYLSGVESISKLHKVVSATRIQHLIHNVEQDLNRICECKLGYISCPINKKVIASIT